MTQPPADDKLSQLLLQISQLSAELPRAVAESAWERALELARERDGLVRAAAAACRPVDAANILPRLLQELREADRDTETIVEQARSRMGSELHQAKAAHAALDAYLQQPPTPR